jgi:3-deoxy-manno-octulosonate cytidylyltransferase (CMP-KDO synthetase)
MTTQSPNPAPVTIIIPARLGSTRFPAKVLADATGMPLIRHVWESASRSRRASEVVIATDDDRVRTACDAFGARCVMTSPLHPNGTSRLSEAARLLQLPDGHVVVNVQGDEPELDAGLIDGAVTAMERTGAEVGTVVSPFAPGQDPKDPNIVKCVMREDGTAVYFSRAAIPFDRDGSGAAYHRHVGIYAYSAGFLHRYAAMASTPLENAEKLEQLRVLEHGYRIGVAVMASSHEGIDTPEQYARFVARWKAGNEKPRR